MEMAHDQFAELFRELIRSDRSIAFDNVLFYLTLMRNEREVRRLVSGMSSDLPLLEDMMLYAAGRAMMNDRSPDLILESILFFLDQETFVRLLLESRRISQDRSLTMQIVLKLDGTSIERYFAAKENAAEFFKGFVRLPDYKIRMMIAGNPSLFGYFRQFAAQFNGEEQSEEFLTKYTDEIRQVDRIKTIIKTSKQIREDSSSNQPDIHWRHLKYLAAEIYDSCNYAQTMTQLEKETSSSALKRKQ